MSRKHFEAFAAKIRAEIEALKNRGLDPGRNPAAFLGVKRTAEMVGEVCIETNERFDYTRFIKACGIPEIDEEKAMVELQEAILAR